MQDSHLTALLDQLRSSQSQSQPLPDPNPQLTAAHRAAFLLSQSTAPAPAPVPSQSALDALLSSLSSRPKDPATLSFQEALPVLQDLASDESWLEMIAELKAQQEETELRWKDERNRLMEEGKRAGISEQVQKQRLKEWDRELLVRWKRYKEDQQVALQEMGVPTFSKSTEPLVLNRQLRVIEVLRGFLDDQ